MRYFSNPGSKSRDIQEPYINSEGARCLRVVGKEDLNGFIQSFKEQTDINIIIKRFQLGDVSALNAQKGMYGDFTSCPRTLSDFLNAQIQAKLLFERLPASVRSTFDNDVDKFFVSMGSPEWFDKVKPFLNNSSNTIESTEVTSNES